MTVNAVHKAIKELQNSEREVNDFIWGLESKKKFTFDNIGEVELVASETGYEGGPELIWIVFRVVGDDRLFKLTGHYSSWDADDWTYGDIYEVEPQERVVVDFIAKR